MFISIIQYTMILNGRQHTTFVPRYTMVHGQCLTVGVGGFILGGGEQLLIITQVQKMPVVWLVFLTITMEMQELMPWAQRRGMGGAQKMSFKCG